MPAASWPMSDEQSTDPAAYDDRTPYEYCAHCGERLTHGEWHPVSSDSEDGSVVAVYSFCNDACQTAWTAEQ